MSAVSFTVHGLDELKRFLEKFPGQLSTRIVRQALHDAANVGVRSLKAEAREHDGRGEIRVNMRTLKRRIAHLSDSAVAVTRHYANGIEYTAVGFEWPLGAAGWLVEHGHRMVVGGTVARIAGRAPKADNRTLTGAGRVVGFVKPHPIALPAFEKCRAAMDEAFEAAVRDGVEENAAG
jgi:hypothetical protein